MAEVIESPMKVLRAALVLLAVGCSHLAPGGVDVRGAARAALNFIDPQAEARIVFGSGVDVRTQRLLRGVRPPAAITAADMLTYLPEDVIRIDKVTVRGDTVTLVARKGPVPRPVDGRSTLDCGTGYTLEVRRDRHSWIFGLMAVDVC